MNATEGAPTAGTAVRRPRLASPGTALVLGLLTIPILAAWVPLTLLTHDLVVSNDGFVAVIAIAFAGVGTVVARRQPRNPIGWIMIVVGLLGGFETDVRLYLVLGYRIHHDGLPLGRAALFWNEGYSLLPILFGLQAILLFPDGRLSRAWRWVLRAYLALVAVFMAAQYAGEASVSYRGPITLTLHGAYAGTAGPTGLAGEAENWSWALVLAFLVFWAVFVGYQVVAWRRSSGERRAQLKWLASGAACCVAGCCLIVPFGDGSSVADQAVAAAAAVAITAFPAAIGVGILKYRLYEIDRLIGRTIAYAIVTAALLGVFVGLVALTTGVLPFSSPVGVAASTLAAAVLFNPLRQRVQRLVDRRFNRSRYDVEAIAAAFSVRLRDAVDLETVREELLHAVDRTVQPERASLWIRPA